MKTGLYLVIGFLAGLLFPVAPTSFDKNGKQEVFTCQSGDSVWARRKYQCDRAEFNEQERKHEH